MTFKELQRATSATYRDRPTLSQWWDRVVAAHPTLAATRMGQELYPGDIDYHRNDGTATVHFTYPTRPGMRPTPRSFVVGWHNGTVEFAYVS